MDGKTALWNENIRNGKQHCKKRRVSKTLPWSIVTSKASLAHAGAIVNDQSLNFVAHLVLCLLKERGWEWNGWCYEGSAPLNIFRHQDLIRRRLARPPIRSSLGCRSLYGDITIQGHEASVQLTDVVYRNVPSCDVDTGSLDKNNTCALGMHILYSYSTTTCYFRCVNKHQSASSIINRHQHQSASITI